MRKRFSTSQILGFLREAAAGTPVMDLCWNHCFSRSTFRAWEVKYGESIHAETRRLKQLEAENARLRKALARVSGNLELELSQSPDAPLLPMGTKRIAPYRSADALSR